MEIRHVRLASGQILWVYIAAHFSNHALGLILLAAAEAGLKVAAVVWQSWPGTLLLYGAFGTHLLLALAGLYQRHTLLLPPLELMRIVFGLTIPLLLFGHVVGTRVAYSWYGEAAQYQRVVAGLARDGGTGWQLALLAPGWAHGCMGLNLAFRHRGWYTRWQPGLIAAAVALPLLAPAGYWAMVGEVAALDKSALQPGIATAAQRQALASTREGLLMAYFGLLALVLVSRTGRDWLRSRRGRVPD